MTIRQSEGSEATNQEEPAELPENLPGERPEALPEAFPETPAPSLPAPLRELPLEGEETSVDPAVITAHRWVGMSLTLGAGGILLIVSTLAWLLGGLPSSVFWLLMAAFTVVLVAIGLFAWQWPAVHYRHLFYRVDRQGLGIRRGVIWRKVISIPTTRVQHIDVTQGPLQRVHGLATLTIHTAGTQGASIPLSGLAHHTATELRDHLLPNSRHGQ